MASESYARFNRYLDRLSDGEVLVLSRLAAKRAAPIYARIFEANQRTGDAAAQSKRERGYAEFRREVEEGVDTPRANNYRAMKDAYRRNREHRQSSAAG